MPITPPLGVWLHKEDASKIEIFTEDNILGGRIISSKNPNYSNEIFILKNFKFVDGKWKGEFYNVNYKRWVEANMTVSGDFLTVNYKYGFIKKNFYLYKETSN